MWNKLRRHWGMLGFLLLLAWFGEAVGRRSLQMTLFAMAVHEGGHLLALKLLGVPGAELRLSPFGAVLRTEDLRLSYPMELLAVIAGPGANLLCGAALNALVRIYPGAAAYAGAHWTLGIFNLLPAAPLDGWHILQLLLCWWFGPERGERAVGNVGATFSLLLSGSIVCLMYFSGGNLWLLPAAIGLAVSGIRAATE